jgi:hypothetical protein
MTLTDEQIKELKMIFPSCPNPIHEPAKFMHYVKMYLTHKALL